MAVAEVALAEAEISPIICDWAVQLYGKQGQNLAHIYA